MSYPPPCAEALQINTTLARRILTGFVYDEVTKFGFERVVVGLSGGVDSSLSCFIGVEALGPPNVTGLSMPYKTSSPQSAQHARAVACMLGIELLEIHITPQMDAYFECFPDADRGRRGNKMARERMTILYDHSMARRALVLGTSNKTEALLGYTTLWGDMACAINPLGDLYKTQVRQLAADMGVPAEIIGKAPSADLWPGQTDEAEIGVTYEEVDRLLYWMIDERMPFDQLVQRGFDPAFIRQVYVRVRDSQYKRRMPIIGKLSSRSLDREFRYSRDWGR